MRSFRWALSLLLLVVVVVYASGSEEGSVVTRRTGDHHVPAVVDDEVTSLHNKNDKMLAPQLRLMLGETGPSDMMCDAAASVFSTGACANCLVRDSFQAFYDTNCMGSNEQISMCVSVADSLGNQSEHSCEGCPDLKAAYDAECSEGSLGESVDDTEANSGIVFGVDVAQDTCADQLGWPNAAGQWESGLWSPQMAVSLFGNTPDHEEYQIPPPGCPENCTRRSVTVSASSTTEWDSPVRVFAGGEASCAVRQGISGMPCWGSDSKNTLTVAQTFDDRDVTDVAMFGFGMCALVDGETGVNCWGGDNPIENQDSSEAYFTDVEFTKLSSATAIACGAMKTGGIKCWYMGIAGPSMGTEWTPSGYSASTYSSTEFSEMCVGGHSYGGGVNRVFVCGIEKDTGTGNLKCFGSDGAGIVTGANSHSGKEFTKVACGLAEGVSAHACGIVKDQAGVECWGADWSDGASDYAAAPSQRDGAAVYSTLEFTEITAGWHHTCGIVKDAGTVKCWGWDGFDGTHTQCTHAENFAHMEFAQIAAGYYHTCGVTISPVVSIKCWGNNGEGQVQGATDDHPPASLKLLADSSCKTEHAVRSGSTACTSCHDSRSSTEDECVNDEKCHFTILDPKTNTGTCTETACPACKPAACCGAHHKHFVVNTEALTGVCVRHTDDCTPVCMPRGDNEPAKRRVCSKGCNQLLKVDKDFQGSVPPTTTDESLLYDMVVCQADKRVICDPVNQTSTSNTTSCQTSSTVKAVARCDFLADTWNLGGSCIASYIHQLPGSVCALCNGTTTSNEVNDDMCTLLDNAQCRMPQTADNEQCKRLAMSF